LKLYSNWNTLESVAGTNQYEAMNVKFLVHGNNGLSLTGFDQLFIVASLRLSVCVIMTFVSRCYVFLVRFITPLFALKRLLIRVITPFRRVITPFVSRYNVFEFSILLPFSRYYAFSIAL
jgi:hypothetical protein